MQALTRKEKIFLERVEKNIKYLPITFSIVIPAGLIFSAQGIFWANTNFQIFGYPAFALLYSMLWIAIVVITILVKFNEKKLMSIIRKLRK